MNAVQVFRVTVILIQVSIVFLYHQSDYILTTERAVIAHYNSQHIYANISFFKFNRTYTALNTTIIPRRDLINNISVFVQAYKFLSNEYRPFPITFSRDACKALKENEFGMQNLYTCGNFVGCPLKKKIYRICNWGPDYSKFPPYIPVGQYKLELKLEYFSEELYTLEWYVKVVSVRLF